MNKMVRTELDRLRMEHGGMLTKAAIVDAAKDKSNPLHREFTWNKEEGWKKNLLAEAGRLIQCYFVVIESPQPTKVRALVSLSTDRSNKNGGGYRGIHDVLSDDQMRSTMVEDALRELSYFEAKYRSLRELAPVFVAADTVRGSRKKKAA